MGLGLLWVPFPPPLVHGGAESLTAVCSTLLPAAFGVWGAQPRAPQGTPDSGDDCQLTVTLCRCTEQAPERYPPAPGGCLSLIPPNCSLFQQPNKIPAAVSWLELPHSVQLSGRPMAVTNRCWWGAGYSMVCPQFPARGHPSQSSWNPGPRALAALQSHSCPSRSRQRPGAAFMPDRSPHLCPSANAAGGLERRLKNTAAKHCPGLRDDPLGETPPAGVLPPPVCLHGTRAGAQ